MHLDLRSLEGEESVDELFHLLGGLHGLPIVVNLGTGFGDAGDCFS